MQIHPWVSFLSLSMFPLHLLFLFSHSAATYTFLHATSSPFWEKSGLSRYIKTKKGYFSLRGDFYRRERNVIRIRHDLAWWVHMCVYRICAYVESPCEVLFCFRFSWSSGFKKTHTWKILGKKCYSRLGMPVVYTPKNLHYALAFSDFVWDYFLVIIKWGQIVIKKKSREWGTGKKCSCIGRGWICNWSWVSGINLIWVSISSAVNLWSSPFSPKHGDSHPRLHTRITGNLKKNMLMPQFPPPRESGLIGLGWGLNTGISKKSSLEIMCKPGWEPLP